MNQRQKVLISLTISAVVLTAVCILGALCADAARATDFSKKNLAPSLNCLFGTDWMGRDMLVRTLRGLSISILLGILAAAASAVIALILGALVQTAAMVLMNMIFTPLFMGAPLETVLALMIPAIIPFNVLKAGINGVITFFLYKSISHLMKGN